MSKIECTAVNELIDLVQRRPLDRESEEELLFSAPPAARAPKGTQPPPLFGAGPVFPIDAPALPAPRTRQPALFPVELSSEPTEMRATIPHLLPLAETLEPPGRPGREDDLETVYVARQQPIGPLLKKLALPAAGIVAGGIAIGVVIALATRGAPERASHVSAPSPFVAPALAAATSKPAPPKVESIAPPPAPAPAPVPAKPALVEIRLESDPPGATATLVDNGATTPLGTTPVDATVDPAKQYDVVFALDGRRTKSLHLDPAATQHLAVALETPPAPEAVAASKPAKKAHTHHHHHTAAKHAARVAAAPAAKRNADKADKAPATGTLAVVTTPPCAILIDGKSSGLTSPQKAITLPAGHHSVRLIAATAHVNKLVAVDVEPRRTTRVVQDFTK